ncbi:DUF3987 domain-containing protein [Aestuariivirga litoralis]|uniref:DUF3987 domain-containing protein n=1 Tax=Aestuariivirga litoralis TaxID=2650924 RepID=A0A2W2BGG7_9HYPH|nr:YfjI family protein [Aestuariivirga litoralis]PZF75259.1 DUF3987 domain-containing protein [Aestuariivirga litoralis]
MSEELQYVTLEEIEADIVHLQENAACSTPPSWPEPIPLIRPVPAPLAFPVEALGPVLGNAALGISDIVQCPVAIAACSILGAASLASQAHVDVVHPATSRRFPTSLFLMTVAESGERKSAADHEALTAVRKSEEDAVRNYKLAFAQWRDQQEAWEAARAAIKRKSKGDWQTLHQQLQACGDEPKAPLKPHLLVSEPTFEGLARLLAEGQPSMGLFSAEGGGFLGGHAMRDESRLRVLTGLSELWDGSALRRTRAADGAVHLRGRRLCLHLMVQPNVAPLLLSDEMASGQGFLSRLLVCAPTSMQGKRFQRDVQPWARQAVDLYTKVIGDLLDRSPRTLVDGGLDPDPLSLSEGAAAKWRCFADEMELELGKEGVSSPVRGLRNKSAEMALRIAGVFACIGNETTIGTATLERGITLAGYFLSEAQRLYEASAIKPDIRRAEKLVNWLIQRQYNEISLRDIQVHGPSSLRHKADVAQAVRTLQEHGLCVVVEVQTGGRPTKRLRLSPLAADVI